MNIMSVVTLKSNLHKIVDQIQNEQLLQTMYDFLNVRHSSKSRSWWESLTEEQMQEVLISFDESEDEINLISREVVFGKAS